jgi:hypothetical protein
MSSTDLTRLILCRAVPATSRDRDAAARGNNVAAGYGPPKPVAGTRCPRCHRTAGKRRPFPGSFLGLGIPCALCSPIQAHEVYNLVFTKQATLEIHPCA